MLGLNENPFEALLSIVKQNYLQMWCTKHNCTIFCKCHIIFIMIDTKIMVWSIEKLAKSVTFSWFFILFVWFQYQKLKYSHKISYDGTKPKALVFLFFNIIRKMLSLRCVTKKYTKFDLDLDLTFNDLNSYRIYFLMVL